jgi:D-alanyl-lipoteichoic acid acyltransferase DltB (MBOAT superfamily)
LIYGYSGRPHLQKRFLWIGIVANLLLLGYYKYFFPMLTFAATLGDVHRRWPDVVLPLGISFFTFTQIGYLVDLSQDAAEKQDFPGYVLFVTFFPHLIAGPLLHHKEMMPQFNDDRRYALSMEDLAIGFTWFVMGLFKKVAVADTLAKHADAAFANAHALTFSAAWAGVLAYALQLYFDFSGYSDMALGLARMFSIRLPLNFNSPYKAQSITEYWNRWHMTLTRYATLYLYNPILIWITRRRISAGKSSSRKAAATPGGFLSLLAFPTMFTMFLVGIWHGAGFKFLIFGLLHGIYLTVNQLWRLIKSKKARVENQSPIARRFNAAMCVGATLLAAVVADVFFRASDTGSALAIVGSMFGIHSFTAAGSLSYTDFLFGLRIAALWLFVWIFPNTQQILSRFEAAGGVEAAGSWLGRRLLWSPTISWAIVLGLSFLFALIGMQDPSRFLYFQF